jgi:hypothetical protein
VNLLIANALEATDYLFSYHSLGFQATSKTESNLSLQVGRGTESVLKEMQRSFLPDHLRFSLLSRASADQLCDDNEIATSKRDATIPCRSFTTEESPHF